MRLKNIDFFKGLLILLVILGHVLQGKMEEAVWRTIIYSFHMPLFIGISGFLFNVNKLINGNFIELIKKYLFRIIIPWIIAVMIFFLLLEIHNHTSNIVIRLIRAFIVPYYHLWFIPGFFSWIILTWFLKKIKVGNRLLIVIGFFISLFSLILREYPEIHQDFGILKSGINLILYTFRPYFYFFFIFGLEYRQLKLKKPRLLEYILPVIGLISVIYLFYFPNKVFSIINFFLFNTLFLSLIIKISVHNLINNNKIIQWIGVNSLAIYLYHVLPILICKYVIGVQDLTLFITTDLTLFYTLTIGLELIFIITYNYLLKIDILKKYVFGMPTTV